MAEKYNRWERFYNKLNLWFNGAVAISIIPFALIFLDTQSEFPDPPLVSAEVSPVIQGVVTVLVVLIVWFGIQFPARHQSELSAKNTIESKLDFYLKIRMKSYLILEVGAILVCLGFYLTKSQLFSGVYLAVMFVFSMIRPTFEKIAQHIGVSQTDLADWGKQSVT
ncbi:hypothetical protein [Marinoscillum sp.]|uniref:hypothetical protein n=1 Tax=Marinoscillum sp. TaxID=2024838 RepID=UPI003BAD0D18